MVTCFDESRNLFLHQDTNFILTPCNGSVIVVSKLKDEKIIPLTEEEIKVSTEMNLITGEILEKNPEKNHAKVPMKITTEESKADVLNVTSFDESRNLFLHDTNFILTPCNGSVIIVCK